ERYTTVLGMRTRYLEAGAGQPVLLLHGLGNSCIVFRPNMRELGRYFHVLAPDLPGHGRSDKPDGIRYDGLNAARFIAEFLRATGSAPAHLIGVSAGGLISGLAASYYPHLVRKVVLVASAGLGPDLSWRLKLPAIPWLGRFFVPKSRRSLRAVLQNIVYDPSIIADDAVQELYEERAIPGNGDALAKAFNTNIGPLGLLRWRAYRQRLVTLPLPVLIVWGRQDRLLPVRHAYAAVREMKDARLHVFDRCGHWPPFEHGQEFNRLVKEFLVGADLQVGPGQT
ncbi:MAG: alpha/beta fold hydrolase, partial [Dehalococcoidia bacterium]